LDMADSRLREYEVGLAIQSCIQWTRASSLQPPGSQPF
jgi:hypothetical protein